MVYSVTVFKIGCRFNKEYINNSCLKILKQQIWSRAPEITFDMHNENSHGAANLLFRTQHNVRHNLKITKVDLLHPNDWFY